MLSHENALEEVLRKLMNKTESVSFATEDKETGAGVEETYEQFRDRFISQINTNETAVTAEDYIRFTKDTPGLCIVKANAWVDDDKNEVKVVAMPGENGKKDEYGDKSGNALNEMQDVVWSYDVRKFPKLSDEAKERIEKFLDEKRLLSTFVQVIDPEYAPVNVSGRIYVKPQFMDCEAVIRNVLVEKLDYVRGEQGFGKMLCLDEIFRELEQLECVSFIQELRISSEDTKNVVMEGADLCPGRNCLLYPGEIEVEIFTEI